jgi:hypothetical protein
LPVESVVRLARRCLPIFVVSCLAGLTTSAREVSSLASHLLLGLGAFVLIAVWVSWMRWRPRSHR